MGRGAPPAGLSSLGVRSPKPHVQYAVYLPTCRRLARTAGTGCMCWAAREAGQTTHPLERKRHLGLWLGQTAWVAPRRRSRARQWLPGWAMWRSSSSSWPHPAGDSAPPVLTRRTRRLEAWRRRAPTRAGLPSALPCWRASCSVTVVAALPWQRSARPPLHAAPPQRAARQCRPALAARASGGRQRRPTRRRLVHCRALSCGSSSSSRGRARRRGSLPLARLPRQSRQSRACAAHTHPQSCWRACLQLAWAHRPCCSSAVSRACRLARSRSGAWAGRRELQASGVRT